MQEYYKILGLTENATNEEIEIAYNNLKSKYSKDRFLEGEAGNEAAKNLTKLETAYAEIIDSRKQTESNETNEIPSFVEVEDLIRQGDFNGAQTKLDAFSTRDAEWHYLQSVIFYKKNWANESKKQLEIAISLDPSNQKYKTSYEKLKTKMQSNERAFYSGNANYGADGNPETPRQMGGTNDCFTFCATWCCIDMLCSICCR